MDTIPAVGASFTAPFAGRDIPDIPLFASLDEASRRRLLAAARTERVPANATLFAAGELATALHSLLRGMIAIACA